MRNFLLRIFFSQISQNLVENQIGLCYSQTNSSIACKPKSFMDPAYPPPPYAGSFLSFFRDTHIDKTTQADFNARSICGINCFLRDSTPFNSKRPASS
jgi:hypothetical protein